MRDVTLEFRTKSGSMYTCERTYDDDGSVIYESWRRGNDPLPDATDVSYQTFLKMSEEYNSLNRNGDRTEERLLEIIAEARKKDYLGAPGFIVYLDNDGLPVIKQSTAFLKAPKLVKPK